MQTIGFIGLGIMGKPMAKNLVAAGFPLIVYDIASTPVAELAALGATPAFGPGELAAQSDLIVTMLPETHIVAATLTGAGCVFDAARPGTLIVDMSTILPSAAVKLAQEAEARGLTMLDAPVSGGERGAIQATLSIMVGGAAEAFERARPVFEALGKTIVHVGNHGAGQITKVCNQIMVAHSLEGMAEAFAIGERAGVDLHKVMDVLRGGMAQTRVMDMLGEKVLARDFKPGATISIFYKDLSIVMATGSDLGVPLPSTAVIRELYGSMRSTGRIGYDHSGIVTVLEDLAGLHAVEPTLTPN